MSAVENMASFDKGMSEGFDRIWTEVVNILSCHSLGGIEEMTVRSGFDPSTFCMRVWGAQHEAASYG
jgi:hypothetical protein